VAAEVLAIAARPDPTPSPAARAASRAAQALPPAEAAALRRYVPRLDRLVPEDGPGMGAALAAVREALTSLPPGAVEAARARAAARGAAWADGEKEKGGAGAGEEGGGEGGEGA